MRRRSASVALIPKTQTVSSQRLALYRTQDLVSRMRVPSVKCKRQLAKTLIQLEVISSSSEFSVKSVRTIYRQMHQVKLTFKRLVVEMRIWLIMMMANKRALIKTFSAG